ncbi:uncharacterized protein FYW47_012952 [Aplochiton taeniatus]
MANNHEDVIALQGEGEETTETALDQKERSLPVLAADSGEEWETDLESDKSDQRSRLVSPRDLYLQACKLSKVVPISFFLRHLGTSTLDLSHHGLGPMGSKALAITLVSDFDITDLELEDNFLLAEGTQYLMEMLKENINIQSMNLSNNHLQLDGAYSVSRMLQDNVSIKCLNLSGNGFKDDAAKMLADALANNYRIKDLTLSHNQFCEAGGEHLGQMLANNEGLEILNLSWNYLRMSGAVALCNGLKVNVTLKQLDLSWNGLGRVGAQALGEALRQNNTLVLLDLSNNRIDNEATGLLCYGLATNDSLRVLRLTHNPLTHIGALMLLNAVKNNTKSALEEINIASVLVNEAFVKLLEVTCQDRASLEVQYKGVMGALTRAKNPSIALKIFQTFLEERKEGIMDFFQRLATDGTTQVSNSVFRKFAQQGNIFLDQQQLEWLIQRFDKECTGKIECR